MGGKQEGWKTQEKNFSPRPTNFFLPNREEKQGEKTALRQFYCNALPLTLHSRPSPNPPKTFVPNPYHLFSSSYLYLQHTVHCSRFSPIFFFFFYFFFFQRDLLFLILIILLIFLLIFWFHMTFKFFSFFLSFSYHVLISFCLFLSLAKGLLISSPAETGMIFSTFFAIFFFIFFIPFFPNFLLLANPFGIIESMHLKNLCIVCLFSSTSEFGASHSHSLPPLLLAFSVLYFGLRWSVAEALYPCLFFTFKFSICSVHYFTGNF